MGNSNYSFGRRILDAVTMFFVMWVSLLCLIYVAYGEANRTYEQFQGDKLRGQAQIVQNVMETFLRAGLPLKQFVGFNTLAEQILASDDTIAALTVQDPSGEVLFGARNSEIAAAPSVSGWVDFLPRAEHSESQIIREEDGQAFLRSGDAYLFEVSLRNKFENVGTLSIEMPHRVVEDHIRTLFDDIIKYSPIPAVVFALLVAVFSGGMKRGSQLWPRISFVAIFVVSAALVIVALLTLYSEGAQTKARALAQSLGQRLQDLVEFNINIHEIEGLDRTFGHYLQVNPDLSSAVLTIDNEVVIHTDPEQIGTVWHEDRDNYAYVVDLTPHDHMRDVKVAVELPQSVVTGQIIRSVKNFAALFVASAFLANLFFQVGGVVRSTSVEEEDHSATVEHSRLVNYLNPVFLLAVLSEHLSYAFLPQFVQELAQASAVPENWATAPFVAFYAVFALVLIPAGHIAQRLSPRPLMYAGLFIVAAAMWSMSGATDFWTVVAARAASGLGQGLIFIGVQYYLLTGASPRHKTQAAAVIVYGFQGGMISGMAIGSLLVGTMGREGVFGLGAVIALVAALYTVITVPALSRAAIASLASPATSGVISSIWRSLRDLQFMAAMIGIGVPAKAVLTGVVTFALPLLLTSMMFPQEDIGQMIMVYAVAVVISSRMIAPKVDSLGNSQIVLFLGTALSSLGLLTMAAAGLYDDALTAMFGTAATAATLLLGIACVGVAHGFINAPVVTFVAESRLASTIGAGAATSTYRFMERIGHVAGPMIVAQLFLLFVDDWMAIGAAGLGILVLGLAFLAVCGTGAGQRDHSSHAPVRV